MLNIVRELDMNINIIRLSSLLKAELVFYRAWVIERTSTILTILETNMRRERSKT